MPKLHEKSQLAISKTGLTNAHIEIKDLWDTDLSNYDIITVYPMPDIMAALEEKIKKEAKKGVFRGRSKKVVFFVFFNKIKVL